jgi:replicative DNA helicase
MNNTPELHCISALMKAPADVYSALSAGLDVSHFADTHAATIFAAITQAAADTRDTGVHAVWLKLADMKGESTPSLPDLIEIDNLQPTSAMASTLVAQVLGNARRRKLQRELAMAATLAANESAANFEEIWQSVAPHIEAAQSITATGRSRTLAEMAASLEQQLTQPDKRRVISTGWASWDAKATPLRTGEMVTLAARPGCGKTALGLQLAVKAAERGELVVFFSLEMSGEELVDRVAKMRAKGRPHIESVRDVASLQSLIVYDNTERHTMASIEARARLQCGASERGLGLVVIDYLQLIDPSDRRVHREQQVAEISRRCKQLAGILHCPVLVLAQLNREIEKDDRRPRLSDLRESGAIEQDSDRVWFIWQDPAKIIPGAIDASSIEVMLMQAKCRGGPPNVATSMIFNRPVFTFNQVAYEN